MKSIFFASISVKDDFNDGSFCVVARISLHCFHAANRANLADSVVLFYVLPLSLSILVHLIFNIINIAIKIIIEVAVCWENVTTIT